MKAQRRARVEVAVEVVHAVKAPEQRDAVVGPVPEVHRPVERHEPEGHARRARERNAVQDPETPARRPPRRARHRGHHAEACDGRRAQPEGHVERETSRAGLDARSQRREALEHEHRGSDGRKYRRAQEVEGPRRDVHGAERNQSLRQR
jgi:hypothetical protein